MTIKSQKSFVSFALVVSFGCALAVLGFAANNPAEAGTCSMFGVFDSRAEAACEFLQQHNAQNVSVDKTTPSASAGQNSPATPSGGNAVASPQAAAGAAPNSTVTFIQKNTYRGGIEECAGSNCATTP